MTNNCDYCKTPFRGERSTKKYCSDNCRQMAYLSRKGYLIKANVSGVKDSVTVDTVNPNVKDIFYDSTVKYSNDIKDVKDITHSSQTTQRETLEGLTAARLAKRIETFEKTVEQQNHLLLTMWTNIKADLETTRLSVIQELGKQLEKHNPFRNSLNGVNYCKPCNVKDFTVIPTVKYSVLIETQDDPTSETSTVGNNKEERENLNTGLNEVYGDSEEEQGRKNDKEKSNADYQFDVNHSVKLLEAEERIRELETELLESNLLLTGNANAELEIIQQEQTEENNKPESEGIASGVEEKTETQDEPEHQIQQADPPYQWIHPKLLTQIQKQIDKGDGGYSFRHALSHWPVQEAKSVLWVNVRLRCLLDNLVRLSMRSHTNYETVSALANAFIMLNNSEAYKGLPNDYPYINLIGELADTFRSIALNCQSQKNTRQRIPIWMSVKRKSTIVAACNELADSTEKVRFSELSFNPVQLQPEFIKQAKNHIEQDDEKRLERRKKWQENMKIALREKERNQKAA